MSFAVWTNIRKANDILPFKRIHAIEAAPIKEDNQTSIGLWHNFWTRDYVFFFFYMHIQNYRYLGKSGKGGRLDQLITNWHCWASKQVMNYKTSDEGILKQVHTPHPTYICSKYKMLLELRWIPVRNYMGSRKTLDPSHFLIT